MLSVNIVLEWPKFQCFPIQTTKYVFELIEYYTCTCWPTFSQIVLILYYSLEFRIFLCSSFNECKKTETDIPFVSIGVTFSPIFWTEANPCQLSQANKV